MPKTFSQSNAAGESYQLSGIDKVIVYRFGNRDHSFDWLSRKRQTMGGNFPMLSQSKLNDWAIKQSSYGSQSENAQDNPFISVATDYGVLYRNGEGWVQKIIQSTPHLGVFAVPFSALYRPNPTKLISKQETEWLYYDGDNPITDYLIEWRDNPFHITLADAGLRATASDPPFALHTKSKSRLALAHMNNGTVTNSGKLGTSGMSLTVSSSTVTDDVATAAYYLQLYGQGAALGQLQQKGQNIQDPAIYRSYDYYSYYIDNLHSLGLNIASASNNKISEKAYSGSIKLDDILLSTLALYCSVDEGATLANMFDLLPTTSDTSLTKVMDFWWANTVSSGDYLSLALSSLGTGNQMKPSLTIVYYNLNYRVAQWRSLFAKMQTNNLDVYTSALSIEYDLELYNSKIYPSIAPVIATYAARKILSA